jgi:hypothetical protein
VVYSRGMLLNLFLVSFELIKVSGLPSISKSHFIRFTHRTRSLFKLKSLSHMVDLEGIEPPLSECKSDALPNLAIGP